MRKILWSKGLDGPPVPVKWHVKGIKKRRMKIFVEGAPVLQEKWGINSEPATQCSTVSAGNASCHSGRTMLLAV